MELPPPEVPAAALDGWEREEERTETLLGGPAVRVRGRTVVYTAGEGARGRFFFATRLAFAPPLPPVVGPAAVLGTVLAAAGERFADRLRDRGLRAVRRERRERLRVGTGERATALAYRAERPPEEGSVPVAGLVAAWPRLGSVRLAGGVYPQAADDDAAYRDELLDLIRGVE